MYRILLIASLIPLFNEISAMDVSVDVHGYQSPDGAYAEVNLYILGSTVAGIPVADSNFYASVEVVLMIKRAGVIVRGDKFNLQSPVGRTIESFFDVKRYALDSGDYVFQFAVRDNADSTNTLVLSRKCSLVHSESDLQLSDVKLLATAKKSESQGPSVRNGIYMESLPFSYYHKKLDQLIFYYELYNLDQQDNSTYYYTFKVLSDDAEARQFAVAHKRLQPAAVIPVLHSIQIDDLPSGNYQLLISIHDRDKHLLGKKSARFIRSNPKADVAYLTELNTAAGTAFTTDLSEDEVMYSLRAIAAKIPETQTDVLNYLVKKGELKHQKGFLQRFWSEYAPEDPAAAYQKYMEVARAVDKMYMSGLGYGFETDRGYFFLKYGRPDDIVAVEDEPSAPPYEIWFYYDFPYTSQTDVKFLFYNPSLSTNDYQLLHSTCIGELQNPRWEVMLYSDDPGGVAGSNSFDATTMQENFNRRAREYFSDN